MRVVQRRHQAVNRRLTRGLWPLLLALLMAVAGPLYAFSWDINPFNFGGGLTFTATSTAAPTLTGDPSSGSYTVHFSGGYLNTLERAKDGGAFTTAQAGRVSTTDHHTKTYSDQPEGEYIYRVASRALCFFNCSNAAQAYSPELTVRVGPPVLPMTPGSVAPTLSDHLDNSYTVHFPGSFLNALQASYNGAPFVTVQAGYTQLDGRWVSHTHKRFEAQPPGSYRYRVKTTPLCFDGCSAVAATYSPERLVMAVAPPPLPATPSPIAGPDTLADRGSGAVASLRWPAAEHTAAAVDYQLQWRQQSGWQPLYSGANTAFNHTGLRADTGDSSIHYRVRACNRSGCSPYSPTKVVAVAQANGPTAGVKTPQAPVLAAAAEHISEAEIRATAQAGLTSGAFRVTETGGASYSLPILTAAGTAGVAPELSLSYSSSGGNGLVGVGWQIGGISSVSRCRQTLHQDGQSLPISWSETDRFCLDGQRLIVRGGAAYGAVGAEYKTELDQHARITSLGGSLGHPNQFKVERKDGSTSYYGAAPGSGEQDARQVVETAAGSATLSWNLKRFSDSVGNPIWYSYYNDSHGQRIREVRYAYGDRPGPAGHAAAVTFHYTTSADSHPRLDPIYAYLAGQALQTTARLASITSTNHGQQLRHYQLRYAQPELGAGSASIAAAQAAPGGGRVYAERFGGFSWGGYSGASALPSDNPLSRLVSITECVDGLCRDPLQFGWGEPQLGESRSPEYDYSNKRLLSWKPADINGDGILDLIFSLHRRSGDDQSVHYLLSDGESLRPMLFKSSSGSVSALYFNEDPSGELLKLEAIDYNADGRSDLAIWSKRANGGRGAWRLYLSTVQPDGSWALSASYIALPMTDEQTTFADVNGDGLVDAISRDTLYLLEHDPSQPASSSRYYRFGSADGVVFPYALDTGGDFSRGTRLKSIIQGAGDFNGDGRADLLAEARHVPFSTCMDYFEQRFPCPRPKLGLKVLLNLGAGENGKLRYSELRSPLTNGALSDSHKSLAGFVKPADLNGDGLTDLVYYQNDRWRWALSDGTQLLEQGELTNSDSGPALEREKNAISQAVQIVDVNRDGYRDFVWHDYPGRAQKVYLWDIAAQAFDTSNAYRLRTTAGNKNHSYHYFDFSGDGIADLVHSNGRTLRVYPGNGGEQMANKITTVRNALGATTHITYQPLGTSSHYQPLAFNTQAQPGSSCSPLPFGGDFCTPSGTIQVVTPASIKQFYTAINGGWQLPEGHHTLGRDINGDGVGDPVLQLNGPMAVVTSVSSSSPAASSSQPGAVDASATSTVSYHYSDAKMQAMGRGFLGFAALTTVDEQSGIRTTTRYRQDFPFIGQPLTTQVSTAEGELLSNATSRWQVNGWAEQADGTATHNARSYAVELAGTEEAHYLTHSDAGQLTVSAQPLTLQRTHNQYDSYGNLTRIEALSQAGPAASPTSAASVVEQRVVTTNRYNAAGFTPAQSQRLGRLSATTVATQRLSDDGGQQTAQRSSAFTYYSSGPLRGLLHTETLEPQQAALRQTLSHHYDRFGNTVKTDTSGYAGADQTDLQTRYNRVEYDADGRYVARRYALFAQPGTAGAEPNYSEQLTEQILARNRYGAATRSQVNRGNALSESINHYTPFGDLVFTADPNGAYAVQLVSRTSSVHCPIGSAFYTLSRGSARGSHGQQLSCFDRVGRAIRTATTSFDGRWVYSDSEYDRHGRPAWRSEPYFKGSAGSAACSDDNAAAGPCWSRLRYDPLGQLWQLKDPRGNLTHTAYSGHTTTTTNPLGQQQREQRNLLGELSAVTDPLGGRIHYQYDAQGNLTATTDSGGHSTTIGYDLLGRKTAMHDPDKGSWRYHYNSFGELVEQHAANGSRTTQRWDRRGRLIERINQLPASRGGAVDAHSLWHYDTATHGLGQLAAVEERISGYIKLPEYDSLGRLTTTVTSLGREGALGDHYEHVTYGRYGRIMQQFDAARNDADFTDNGIEHHYNRYGYLAQLSSARYSQGVPVTRYQTTLAMDARGKVTSEQLGNGVNRSYRYAGNSGLLLGIEADNGTAALQKMTLVWDEIGNLSQRRDAANAGATALQEQFSYDSLNRLTGYRINGGAQQQLRYDALGNITYKTGVGDYRYGSGIPTAGAIAASAAGPHAVVQAGTAHYRYDANGNNIAGDGRTLRYTSYDKLEQVSRGSHTVNFAYGPDRQRFMRRDNNSATNRTTQTLYIGTVEKITHPDQTQTWKRSVGDLIITEQRSSTGLLASSSLHAQLKDHLGSVVAITSSTGQLQQRMAFDPWGARRNASNWQQLSAARLLEHHYRNRHASHASASLLATANPLPAHLTSRGFTGHEMVDEVGIVHMNGRIYDAKLGRFLQADPIVDGVKTTQGFNRYSYVGNNPLTYTDPTGHFKLRRWIGAIVGVVGFYICGPACSEIGWQVAAVGAASGAANAAANGGNILQGAVIGGVSALAFSAVGGSDTFGYTSGQGLGRLAMNALGNGLAGGVMSVLQGGKFGHGFSAAGLSAFAKPSIKGLANEGSMGLPLRVVMRAVLGGTISELTGGKFANGASSAAFSQLFNEEATLARQRAKASEDTLSNNLENKSTDGAGLLRPDGHEYVVGRDGNAIVWPGQQGPGIGSFIDDHVPGGHTLGTNHDALVAFLVTDLGLPDAAVNIPTILPVYIYSLGQEIINIPFRVYDSIFDEDTTPFTHSH